MSSYSIDPDIVRVAGINAVLLRLAFGDPLSNDAIVREVDGLMRSLKEEKLRGGALVLLNGAASLAVMAVITHHLAHLFGTVAVYDPKLEAYVVVVNHGPGFKVGDTISASDVTEVSNGE